MSANGYGKTLVCFANSRKKGGRCVAGKEWSYEEPGEWIRPISHRSSHELSESERFYKGGRDPELLDILSIDFECYLPDTHQRENHRINTGCCWKKQGRLSWSDLPKWVDHPAALWTIGGGSYCGLNNRIETKQADGCSLFLISVDGIQVLVGQKAPEYSNYKRVVRCRFRYRNIDYLMDVTDPLIEKDYLEKPDGNYVINDTVICVSLSDEYKDYYYKLVAGIIFKERFMTDSIYTIGHSNHPIDKFISLLKDFGITALVDVRSQPYSRYFPQYSQDILKDSLQREGIAYVFLGKELGARSENPDCYRQGMVQYDLLAKEPLFEQGLERLHRGMQNHRIALVCAEKDPLNCHRAVLVARHLHESGIFVNHILANGQVESHGELECRMLKTQKMSEMDLFSGRKELLAEAYNRHGKSISYLNESMLQRENNGKRL